MATPGGDETHRHDGRFHHDHRIESLVLRHEAPVPWLALNAWLNSVLSLCGDRVLRMKGIVWVEGFSRPFILQGVHHLVHPPVQLETAMTSDSASKIVMIVQDLSAEGLEKSFARAMA